MSHKLLKSTPTLPNPFEFQNGSMVTEPMDWERRREELSELIQFYAFGCILNPQTLTYEVNTNESNNLKITMNHEGNETSFHASVYVPKQGVDTSIHGPYPVLIVIGSITETQIKELFKNGYAVIMMATAPVYSDNAYRTGAYTTLFPYKAGDYPYDSGALMAWGWGVSRIIDALEMNAFADINPKQTMVTGVSRNGKAALLAGAFDRRIAVTIPVDTGQAGTSSFRYNVEGRIYNYVGNPFPDGMNRSEKISNMNGYCTHWFSSQIWQFENREDMLPFDSHSVMSLVAPRPLLVFAGEEFDWLSQPSTVLSYTAAKEVYEFLGVDDLIGLHVRKGAHAILDRDIPIMIDFANHEFRGTDFKLSRDHFPYVDTYNEFSSYLPDSSYIPWSRPGKHTLWTKTEQILAGMLTTVIAYSDADTVTLQLPSTWWETTTDSITVQVENGEAVFQIEADQAKAGKYTLTANGEKASKTAAFMGSSWDAAFKTTVTLDGENNWVIHFTDRYNKDGVRVIVNGIDITDVQDPARFNNEMNRQVYFMNYGIRIHQFASELTPDTNGAYHIEILNLQFQNILPEKSFTYRHTAYALPDEKLKAGHTVLLSSGKESGFTVEK